MSITKWKNILYAPTPEKRDKLVDKLTEEDAKACIKFMVGAWRSYTTIEEAVEQAIAQRSKPKE